jgi:hypothetical protein
MPKKQKSLDFSVATKESIDMKVALAIFATARPFNLFENPVFVDMFRSIKGDYNIPSRTTITNSLLPKCYDMVRRDVMGEIRKIQYINISVDESTNIRGERIMNFSLSTPERSFYISSEDMANQSLTSVVIASWVVRKLTELLGPSSGWQKLNSFASDTCNSMRAVWNILRNTEGLENLFYIPCDAHSLQLLMKDLLSLPQ